MVVAILKIPLYTTADDERVSRPTGALPSSAFRAEALHSVYAYSAVRDGIFASEGSADAASFAEADCFNAADRRAYMIAAGCEIPRGTPDENVRAMAEFAERQGPDPGR